MKWLFFLGLVLSQFFAMGQKKYGFAFIAVENISPEDSVMKELYMSPVVNLDSIRCLHRNGDSIRKSLLYYTCLGEWFTGVIDAAYPGHIGRTSEVTNMSQVEISPDYPESSQPRINKMLRDLNKKKVSEYLTRTAAEKRRAELLERAFQDPIGKVYIID